MQKLVAPQQAFRYTVDTIDVFDIGKWLRQGKYLDSSLSREVWPETESRPSDS